MDAGRPFSPERFALLVGDVRSIVAHLHALEFLQHLGKTKGLDPETRQRLEHDARVIGECAPSRFAARGGPPTFKQVAGWVGRHRSELEPLLFESPERPSSETPAPPPQNEKTRARP
jgi:hypothetical protein